MSKDKFYQSDFKKFYINSFADSTIKSLQLERIFTKSKPTESNLNKDLYDFTLSELWSFLGGMEYKSMNPAVRDVSLINKYILYCQEQGHSSNKSSRWITASKEELSKVVYKNLKPMYTRDEILEAIDDDNQYYLIIALLLEGIGVKNFEEIIFLKLEDLFEEDDIYYVRVERNGEKVNIDIPRELHKQLVAYNDVIFDATKRIKYIKTDYIFKPFDAVQGKPSLYLRKEMRSKMYIYLKEKLHDDNVVQATILDTSLSYLISKYIKESGKNELTKEILQKVATRVDNFRNSNGFYYGRLLSKVDLDFIKSEYDCQFEVDSKLIASL